MEEPKRRMLEMRGVEKRFGAVTALAGVDLDVARGEVHALIGENGAGKSTLMKVLAGAVVPDAGTMSLDGVRFVATDPMDARRRGISMIYQELTLAPDLSVEDNVMLGCAPSRWGIMQRARGRGAVRDALAELGHDDIDPTAPVSSLGLAARQVVEIARAIVADAKVVVMDEPTSSLGRADAEQLFKVVRRLADRSIAVIYISHYLEEVERLADRYTVLRDGRSVATGDMARASIPSLIEAMVGRAVAEVFPTVARELGEPVLELRALGGEGLPKSVDLTLHAGEVLGISGLVGAGRTELVRAVYGLAPVRRGEVVVRSVVDRGRTVRQRVAQGMGLVSEDRKDEGLALSLSIAENTTLSALKRCSKYGFVLGRRRGSQTAAWIERLQIRAHGPAQAVGQLSGGNQQKVAIARLLHQDADVLLLDEPTRGVDVGSKVEIYRLIGQLAAEGRAVLFISSYVPELLGVADRIAVMHRGVLGAPRPVDEWTEALLLDVASRGGDRDRSGIVRRRSRREEPRA